MDKKLNILFMGEVPYPEGYASTQLIQTAIDYFVGKGASVYVLSYGAGQEASSGRHRGASFLVISGIKSGVFAFFRAGISFLRGSFHAGERNILINYGYPSFGNLHLLFWAQCKGAKVVHWIVEDFHAYDLKNAEVGSSKLKISLNRVFSDVIKWFTDGVVVLSSWLEQKYQKQGVRTQLVPVSTGRLEIQPYPADEIRRNVIVYAGTMGAKDGVEDLIEAFFRVLKKLPDAMLEIVGSGARRAELERHYANASSVRFLGYLDDDHYNEALASAQALCMTRVSSSYANAGFPYKICDYLATGRPVLATKVSDIERYLTDGESAFLVASGDQQQMAFALEYLLTHPVEADRAGAKGRLVCEKQFNPATNGLLMETFFESLWND